MEDKVSEEMLHSQEPVEVWVDEQFLQTGTWSELHDDVSESETEKDRSTASTLGNSSSSKKSTGSQTRTQYMGPDTSTQECEWDVLSYHSYSPPPTPVEKIDVGTSIDPKELKKKKKKKKKHKHNDNDRGHLNAAPIENDIKLEDVAQAGNNKEEGKDTIMEETAFGETELKVTENGLEPDQQDDAAVIDNKAEGEKREEEKKEEGEGEKKEEEGEDELYEDVDYVDRVRKKNMELMGEANYQQALRQSQDRSQWPYCWDILAHSPNLTLVQGHPDCVRRQVARQSTDAIRGVRGFKQGCHKFRFHFNDKPWGSHCSIGVVNCQAMLQCKAYQHLLGRTVNSYGWDLPSRCLVHDGKKSATPYGTHLTEVPQTITMVMDIDNKLVSYEAEEENLGKAFTLSDTRDPLYPAVSLVYGGAEVTITYLNPDDEQEVTPSAEEETPITVIYDDVAVGEDGYEESDEDARNEESDREDAQDKDSDKEDEPDSQMNGFDNRRTSSPLLASVQEEVEEDEEDVESSEEEEPDHGDDLFSLSSLASDWRHLVEVVHGWDWAAKGGALHLYPGMPNICVPLLSYDKRVQGIRGKTGFKSGRHKWLITEIQSYTPKLQDLGEGDELNNLLIIGVVSGDHRLFNLGSTLSSQAWSALWGWEPHTGILWHGKHSHLYPKQGVLREEIDLSKGLEVLLDVDRKKLSFLYQGRCLGVAFRGVKGHQIYPVVIFNGRGLFPVEMRYLSGPDDYVHDCVDRVISMEARDMGDLVGHKMLHRTPSMSYDMQGVNERQQGDFKWGFHSPGIVLSKHGRTARLAGGHHNDDSVPQSCVAVSAHTIKEKRHIIRLDLPDSSTAVLGLVTAAREKSGDSVESSPSTQKGRNVLLGNSLYSWGWDIANSAIYHAGVHYGKYPSVSYDFDPMDYSAYILTVDFGRNGANVASFSAISRRDGGATDLGIAFLNLPDELYIATVLTTAEQDPHREMAVTLSYKAGPSAYVENLKAHKNPESKACTIL